VGFPVPGAAALLDLGGALVEADPVAHVQGGTAALAGPPAAPVPGPRQVVAPAEVVVADDLGVDEAVDALGAHPPQLAGDLFRRPARRQPRQHLVAQLGIAIEAAAAPAPCLRLLLRIDRAVANLHPAVAPHLPSNGRWRAIQSCSDLPDRTAFGR